MNPVIPGFAPDPSIVLVNDTYYLVNSSFHIFPGLPVYTSTDLLSWTHITNAFNRRDQLISLKYSTTELSPSDEVEDVMAAQGGFYAPTIRYHGGTFYIVCTNVIMDGEEASRLGGRHQNFIISTTDPHSHKWSNPVFFDFDGIDTSLVWDEEGGAYLHGSAAPGPKTTIKMFEIDVKTGKKLGEENPIWKGTGGIWPEGPHIYRKDGWWYLMISEGGTFEEHMITVARSKELFGPYDSNPKNPILTARGTKEYIQHTGHCEMFCDKQGQWWCVCLGVRKDSKGRYIMGRETFLTPGAWPEGEWPSLEQVKIDPQKVYGRPEGGAATLNSVPSMELCYIRDVDLGKYKISDDHTGSGTNITLLASKADVTDTDGPITFVGKRQRKFDDNVSVMLTPLSSGPCKAGLAVYKDEHRFARIYHDAETSEMVFEVVNKAKSISRSTRKECPSAKGIELFLTCKEDSYAFSFVIEGTPSHFEPLDTVELTGPDFVGPILGVFATCSQDEASVDFQSFQVG